MTDTSTRPAAPATRWDRHSSLQTSAELLLGLSFTATVAFGGYAAVTGRMTVLSQVAGIVFLVTLTCVLVSWFRAVERSEAPVLSRRATTAADSVASVASVDSADSIASIDAEYRR